MEINVTHRFKGIPNYVLDEDGTVWRVPYVIEHVNKFGTKIKRRYGSKEIKPKYPTRNKSIPMWRLNRLWYSRKMLNDRSYEVNEVIELKYK